MTQRSFADLGVAGSLQRVLRTENYAHPTPIQDQAIPQLLAGKDLLGIAQTGTGKTAAFSLPILQHLSTDRSIDKRNTIGKRKHGSRNHRRPTLRALILAPTRELALQIGESIHSYGRDLPLHHTVILGGVSQHPQVRALSIGVNILIATPGRLLDLYEQGHVHLGQISHFVLDEADLMLDMGFLRDVQKITATLPAKRQTMLFAATMPLDIVRLARDVLKDPVRVEISPNSVTVEKVDQHVFFIDTANKRALLTHLLQDTKMSRVIVFTRTKRGASRLTEQLLRAGFPAEAIHGNKTQRARQLALAHFKKGAVRVLVATDVAARGIDISSVSHVVNYELPHIPESYVHRIGRTARAGAGGIALSFCDYSERPFLLNIERLTKRPITVVKDHPHKISGTPKRPLLPRMHPPGKSAPKLRGAPKPSHTNKRRSASNRNAPNRRNLSDGQISDGPKPRHRDLSGEQADPGGANPKSGQKRGFRSRSSAS